MTYTPQYLNQLVPPIATELSFPNESAYRVAIANHNELYGLAELSVASWHGVILGPANSNTSALRWRSRRGADRLDGGYGIELRVEVAARSVTGDLAGALRLSGGVASVGSDVTGSTYAVYTLTATPNSTDDEWLLRLETLAGQEIEIASMVAYWVAAAPGVHAYPSEWRQAPSTVYGNEYPVHTEVAARLLNGPVLIARDRPVCVLCHLHQASLSGPTFSKIGGWVAWGVSANTVPVIVGRGRIPAADVRSRTYQVQYFLRSSNGTGGSIRVGATETPVTAGAVGAFELELGAADVDVTASINACGPGEWAYFESIQVWRVAA
jgi:hypothetical protein